MNNGILDILDGEGFLITDKINRKYFSGIDVDEGFFILSKTPTYLTDSRYFYAVKEKLKNTNISCLLYQDINSIKTELENQNIKKLYIDFDTTSLSEYNQYKNFGIELLDGKDIKLKRAVKSEKEISYIKKACKIAENAVKTAFSNLKVGITEKQVKEILVNYMIKNGAEGESFDTIVAFSKNSAVPHHKTGNTKLKENSVVLIDTGCVYKGYCSDITRTAFFGTPSKEFLISYSAVLKANIKAEEQIKSGFSTIEADSIARNSLKYDGLDKYFTHSLGHGVGLEIHEHPYLSPKKESKLLDNMVFSIEPGIYFENKFGIRIEDTVCLINGKVERLFNDSKKLKIIKINV